MERDELIITVYCLVCDRCFAFDRDPTKIREVPTRELCQIPQTRD